MRWGKGHISPGFLLLWALFFFLDRDGVAPWALAACAIHELAHVVSLYWVGGSVKRIRFTIFGAEVEGESRGRLSYGGELLSVLAGPGSNLFLAFLAARAGERWYLFAGLNLSLGIFNLLPLPGLDGGRALRLLALMLFEREEK